MELSELEERYELELDKIVERLGKGDVRSVLLQFPDGLKMYATQVVEFLEGKFPDISFRIWFGSCFGACDIPKTDDDLLVQFGHSEWK
jgi:2-(3-amino-3-carboxypropyl)histidine synthase